MSKYIWVYIWIGLTAVDYLYFGSPIMAMISLLFAGFEFYLVNKEQN